MIEKISFQKNHRLSEFLILAVLFSLPLYVFRLGTSWLSTNPVEILMLISIAMWAYILGRGKRAKSTGIGNIFSAHRRYLVSTILIIVGAALSILASSNYRAGLGILKGWFLLPLIFALGTSYFMRENKKLIENSFRAIFYSGALLAILGLYYWITGNFTYDGRLRIFFDSPNQLAMTLVPSFLAGMFFISGSSAKSGKREIIINLVFLIIILINIVMTRSVGAWVGTVTVLVIIFLWQASVGLRAKLAVLIPLVVISLGLVFFVSGDFAQKLIGERSSLASRAMIWKSAAWMVKDNPILGIGPGNFQTKYLEYQKYFSPYLEWSVPQPHNVFLAFWLEAGILGILGFLLLLIQFFQDNIKKAVIHNQGAALLCFAIILYFLLHGLLDTTYWKNDSAVVFWLAIMINILLSKEKGDVKN